MHGIAGRRTELRADLPAAADAQCAEAETIAEAYRSAHRGDDQAALVAAIADALTDLAAAEERAEAVRRQVSRGYARAGAPAGWQGRLMADPIPCLALYPYVVVRVECGICPARRGAYRLARLAAKYGPETPLDEVLPGSRRIVPTSAARRVLATGCPANTCRGAMPSCLTSPGRYRIRPICRRL